MNGPTSCYNSLVDFSEQIGTSGELKSQRYPASFPAFLNPILCTFMLFLCAYWT